MYCHGLGSFTFAKELYQKAIQGMSENKDFSNLETIAACNMTKDEVLLAAMCGLGQLEAHSGYARMIICVVADRYDLLLEMIPVCFLPLLLLLLTLLLF